MEWEFGKWAQGQTGPGRGWGKDPTHCPNPNPWPSQPYTAALGCTSDFAGIALSSPAGSLFKVRGQTFPYSKLHHSHLSTGARYGIDHWDCVTSPMLLACIFCIEDNHPYLMKDTHPFELSPEGILDLLVPQAID